MDITPKSAVRPWCCEAPCAISFAAFRFCNQKHFCALGLWGLPSCSISGQALDAVFLAIFVAKAYERNEHAVLFYECIIFSFRHCGL